MKHYELMTITNIDLKEEGARDISNSIKDLISSLGGSIKDTDTWGKRKFAYEINHKSEGFYEIINFEVNPSALADLKQKLNLINGLVRYLITATESK